MDDSIPRSILLVFALILTGGFFAGSETAFSFCNEVRMRTLADDGNRRARRVVRILDDFDRTVVTLLIAINTIYILAASIATTAAVSKMGNVGSVVATVVTTLCVFLFAETIPKNIARTNSDAYALFVALPDHVLPNHLKAFGDAVHVSGRFGQEGASQEARAAGRDRGRI